MFYFFAYFSNEKETQLNLYVIQLRLLSTTKIVKPYFHLVNLFVLNKEFEYA